MNYDAAFCAALPPAIRHCDYNTLRALAPGLREALSTFPDNPEDFSWCVKVHNLLPLQYPCIPHWHTDNVPRENGIQRFDRIQLDKPMYLWLSGAPLTQFKHGFVQARRWHRFTQADEHRGCPAAEPGWRVFIRASHRDIVPCKAPGDPTIVTRHAQVYVDAETYQW